MEPTWKPIEHTEQTQPVASFPDRREWIAAILGIAPFFLNLSSTTTTSSNGRITSFQQIDYVDILFGALCIIVILTTIRLWSRTRPQDLMKRRIVFVALLALGAFQIASGLGIFTRI
jgi:uncharacterized membrane protein